MTYRDPHPFTLTPSAWDAYDRLTTTYGIETRA